MKRHVSYIIKNRYFIVIASIVLLCSCGIFNPSVSKFDQYAYTQTISVKVDALDLMDLATEDFESHQKEIIEVKSKLQKNYEYSKHIPKNNFVTEQWRLMIDTTGNLYGGFLVKWEREKKLNNVYLNNKKKQIAFNFDQLAELESKKIKPSDVNN